MTELDPFEQELRAGLAAERAPDSLRRRIARIPLEHPRAAVTPRGTLARWLGDVWLSAATRPWATSFAAAAASLVIGLWLGLSGLAVSESGSGEDELVAMIFSDVPTTIGDEQ